MALYDLRNQESYQKAVEYFHKLLQNPCTIELTKKQPIRSDQQNKYLHVLLGIFSMETGYTIDYVKWNFFKLEVNAEIFVVETEGKLGTVQDVRSSAAVDSAEMTKAIERFRAWAGVKGIDLPAPEDKQWIEWARIEMSRNYHT